MTDFGSDREGPTFGVRPHAFNPVVNPELFEGVLTRRMLAFVIDVVDHHDPGRAGSMFIFLFGIFTLGLGWLLFWLVSPASVIWAIVYYGMTMGSPASATSACGRSTSRSAPGMAAPAISCWVRCMRCCSGSQFRR